MFGEGVLLPPSPFAAGGGEKSFCFLYQVNEKEGFAMTWWQR